MEITGGTVIRLLLPSTVAVDHAVASNGTYKTIKLAGGANYAGGKKVIFSLIYDSVDACWYECGRVLLT